MRDRTRLPPKIFLIVPILLILWGSFAAVSKLVLSKLDSFQLLFYLFGIATVIMSVLFLIRGKFKELSTLSMRDLALILLCGLPSFLYYFLYALSLRLIPAMEASMINYLFPVMIVLAAVPINKEKMNVSKVISLLLGLVGTVVILTKGCLDHISFTNLAGDLLAFGAAVSWGVFSNLGKWMKKDIEICNYIYIVESFILSFISVLCFSKFVLIEVVPFLGVLWLSLSNVVIAYWLWIIVMKDMPATLAACLSFITPFISILFIMLLIGEVFNLYQVLGLLIILSAVAVQLLGNKAFRTRRGA